jgi:hypothetical protein
MQVLEFSNQPAFWLIYVHLFGGIVDSFMLIFMEVMDIKLYKRDPS